MSARGETLEEIDPEERGWLASYLDVFARKYAHELAEKIRADIIPEEQQHHREQQAEADGMRHAADLIDPQKEGQ